LESVRVLVAGHTGKLGNLEDSSAATN